MSRCLQSLDVNPILGAFSGEVKTVYPVFKRVGDTFRAGVYTALVGVELSSSLVIFGGRGAMMVVVGKQDDYLTLSKSVSAPVVHLTDTNSIAGPPPISIPTSKCTPRSFGAFGLPIPPNTPISLYASCDATAGNSIFGVCVLDLIEVRAPSR